MNTNSSNLSLINSKEMKLLKKIGYIVLAFVITKSQKWDIIKLGIVLLASLLPFATFFVE